MFRRFGAVVLVATVCLLGACKKSPPPDCDGAGAAVTRAAEDLAAHARDELGRQAAQRLGPAAGATVTSRCKLDHWSAAATSCIKAARGGSIQECEPKLTPSQRDALRSTMPPMDGLAAAARGCGEVMRTMTKFWEERARTAPSDQARDAAKAMGGVAATRIGKHCAQDDWSPEAIDCFKLVADGDFASCESKLTKDQIEKLRNDAPPMAGSGASIPLPPTPAGGSAQVAP